MTTLRHSELRCHHHTQGFIGGPCGRRWLSLGLWYVPLAARCSTVQRKMIGLGASQFFSRTWFCHFQLDEHEQRTQVSVSWEQVHSALSPDMRTRYSRMIRAKKRLCIGSLLTLQDLGSPQATVCFLTRGLMLKTMSYKEVLLGALSLPLSAGFFTYLGI